MVHMECGINTSAHVPLSHLAIIVSQTSERLIDYRACSVFLCGFSFLSSRGFELPIEWVCIAGEDGYPLHVFDSESGIGILLVGPSVKQYEL